MSEGAKRAGFAAVIGAPNAGKSTLVNRLVGSKVSIVTQKVQTTRFPVRGVAIEGKAQIVLVDTPGVFAPRRRLDRAMVRSAWAGAEDADAVVHLVDVEAEVLVAEKAASGAQHKGVEDARTIVEGLRSARRKAILALNKIDMVKRDTLLAVADRFFQTEAYAEVFMISAENGSGVADLKQRLATLMPEGPWLYPEDQTADLPARLLAAEITREKVYLRVHEELPYAAAVETTAFEERRDGSARLEQTIYVEREGQRAILLGKGGQTLKWIGQKSREELAHILDRPIHLFLHVKVVEDWQNKRDFYRDTGLDFDAQGARALSMEFSDDAFVLSARAHGETGAIVELLTAEHGRYAGHLAGGASRKMKPFLQPGAQVLVEFRARTSEQLGSIKLEPVGEGPSALFDDALALAGLSAAAAVAAGALPEREPHPGAYLAFEALVAAFAHDAVWPAVFVRFEAGLLEELGFGLDLSRCAATGSTDELIYVSPKTGRAVSRTAGAPYAARMLTLPPFLLGGQAGLREGDVGAGFTLTGHFLEQFVFGPLNRPLPPARVWLLEQLGRAQRL